MFRGSLCLPRHESHTKRDTAPVPPTCHRGVRPIFGVGQLATNPTIPGSLQPEGFCHLHKGSTLPGFCPRVKHRSFLFLTCLLQCSHFRCGVCGDG